MLFSSTNCNACSAARAQLAELSADDLVIQEITWQDDPEVHRRYRIPAVPTTVLVTASGATFHAVIGRPGAGELAGELERARRESDD